MISGFNRAIHYDVSKIKDFIPNGKVYAHLGVYPDNFIQKVANSNCPAVLLNSVYAGQSELMWVYYSAVSINNEIHLKSLSTEETFILANITEARRLILGWKTLYADFLNVRIQSGAITKLAPESDLYTMDGLRAALHESQKRATVAIGMLKQIRGLEDSSNGETKALWKTIQNYRDQYELNYHEVFGLSYIHKYNKLV